MADGMLNGEVIDKAVSKVDWHLRNLGRRGQASKGDYVASEIAKGNPCEPTNELRFR